MGTITGWKAMIKNVIIVHIDEIPQRYRNGFLSNLLPELASTEPQTAIDLFHGLAHYFAPPHDHHRDLDLPLH